MNRETQRCIREVIWALERGEITAVEAAARLRRVLRDSATTKPSALS